MCRNITTLRGIEPTARVEEVWAGEDQYLGKVDQQIGNNNRLSGRIFVAHATQPAQLVQSNYYASVVGAWGWYRDHLVYAGGRWLFRERRIETQFRLTDVEIAR